CDPPDPVLPLSVIVTVIVTFKVAFGAVVYIKPLEAIKVLISAIVPVMVKALAVPPTVTPVPLVAASAPVGTENVAVTIPGPASTSAKLMPVSAEGSSSFTAMVAGTVTVGASFTGVILMFMVP